MSAAAAAFWPRSSPRSARVSGVDPSVESLEVARAHARESGFEIDYREGFGEDPPVADASFDAVYCCDVLEHVDDVGRTVREIARVPRAGGVFLYDTINRTASQPPARDQALARLAGDTLGRARHARLEALYPTGGAGA